MRLGFMLALGLLLLSRAGWAFDLPQLADQLISQQPIQGDFVQQKHLRALPMPLVSRGHYSLSAERGLLWQLRQPLEQDYRIDEQGVALLTENGWQLQSNDVAARQNKLFLAVLRGDYSGLEQDFELNLSGDPQQWQLELTPKSLLLRQVFERILIQGQRHVERVELFEVQGDRTLMQFLSSDVSDHAGQH